MPSQWDHRADKDLLLTIIEDGNLTHINWQNIAIKLQQKDYTFSHEACRQHYQKIRKESKNSAPGNGNGFTTPTKATPSAKATPASRKKTVNNNSSSNSNEDDEEDMKATPSAKRKRIIKEKTEPQENGGFIGQTAAQFKFEANDGSGSGNAYNNAADLSDDGIYA